MSGAVHMQITTIGLDIAKNVFQIHGTGVGILQSAAADAEAICEAVRRPTMRFVRIKSAEQQGQLMQHRTRDLLMRQRTQVINALRAHLAELGIVAAQGDKGVKELLAIVADKEDTRLPID